KCIAAPVTCGLRFAKLRAEKYYGGGRQIPVAMRRAIRPRESQLGCQLFQIGFIPILVPPRDGKDPVVTSRARHAMRQAPSAKEGGKAFFWMNSAQVKQYFAPRGLKILERLYLALLICLASCALLLGGGQINRVRNDRDRVSEAQISNRLRLSVAQCPDAACDLQLRILEEQSGGSFSCTRLFQRPWVQHAVRRNNKRFVCSSRPPQRHERVILPKSRAVNQLGISRR